jgi:hypothetical protein
MAIRAEALQLDEALIQTAITPRPTLYAVEDPVNHLVDADTVPELRFARLRAGQEAASILGRNRQLLYEGETESVPRAVDALGTVRQVVEAKREFGADSPQYKEKFEGLMLDSERLLGEAYSKHTSEYFAEVLQSFDPAKREYSAHGLSVKRMVTNGLSPAVGPEERARRANEYVEEGTYEAIGTAIGHIGLQGMAERIPEPAALAETESPALSVMTVSECTDEAIKDYELNPKGSHGGYAPGIRKFMVRGVHFTESGDRLEEQVAVPGLYITHEVITEVLAGKGAIAQGEELSKTELHAKQLISVNGEGVMDLVKELDQKAGEKSGKRIFMGEKVPADHEMDYDAFVGQAEIRRQKLAPKPQQLAEYLVALEEGGTDGATAEALVNVWLKRTLLEVAGKNPDLAEAMFDQATAEGFREVARLKAEGQDNEARWLQAQVERNAPEVSYCGAGSCGLEAASPGDVSKAQRLGLKGEIIHDKERPCPACSAMKVVYGENGKACTGCDYVEVNGETKRPSEKESDV